jgi:ATPase subunit of ABC transporter with duplicated ATPase domains
MLLDVHGITKTLNGEKVLDNVSFSLKRGDKVLFVGESEVSKSMLFQILAGEVQADSGSFKWGVTTNFGYLPKDHNPYFEGKTMNLIDWLREFSEDKSENFIRSFLGRMLFSGEETLKAAGVLSGGEKVRCLLAKMMLQGPNVLLLDGPTNHLDLESITSLNTAVVTFPGTVLLATHDQYFAETASNRVLEFKGAKVIDHQWTYEEYIASLS